MIPVQKINLLEQKYEIEQGINERLCKEIQSKDFDIVSRNIKIHLRFLD